MKFPPMLFRPAPLSLLLAVAVPVMADDPMDPPPPEWMLPAPVLSPEESMATMRVEDGFRIELVASEPLIHDPVALDIDARGRLWVIEMQAYMPDVRGTGENEPIGRIVILEDTNGDGRMDDAKVFMDEVVMPRTIAVVDGGIIYCSPPELVFVENLDDQPGERTVIDPTYARGGNVEHQANGMMRALDNWRYNAKSDRRYRRIGGEWVMERTENRGQWGICQDNYGRLFYNHNSANLFGDVVPPSALMRHPGFESNAGINRRVARDNTVWPARVTAGVNRGYRRNQLTRDGYLTSFTAACGPLIYRGDQFPGEYLGDSFVCEPAANLIKRNVMTEDPRTGEPSGVNAYQDKEFLTSTDERFRPVSLYNAPDGTMLVVDMYRGIIQHRTYLTPYLRDYILELGLDQPTGLGRIYRVVHDRRPVRREAPDLSALTSEQLVPLLGHANGWHRDTAQRLLIDRGDLSVVPRLTQVLAAHHVPLGQIHVLWTLEGLGAVSAGAIAAAGGSRDAKVLSHVVRVAEVLAGTPDAAAVMPVLERIAQHDSLEVRRQLAFSLGRFPNPEALRLLTRVLDENGGDSVVRAGALSGLVGQERALLALWEERPPRNDEWIDQVTELAEASPLPPSEHEPNLEGEELEQYRRGLVAYELVCLGCHMADGRGLAPVAPPLVDSEWVTGDPVTLALILLHGVMGPIEVAGKLYDVPDIQPVMPGLRDNPEVDDAMLADIMTYVRNAWGHEATAVSAAEVNAVRRQTANRAGLYTADELKQLEAARR